MNRKQVVVLWIGVAAFTGSAVYVPVRVVKERTVTAPGGPDIPDRIYPAGAGLSGWDWLWKVQWDDPERNWVFSKVDASIRMTYHAIYWPIIGLEWAVTSIIALAALATLQRYPSN